MALEPPPDPSKAIPVGMMQRLMPLSMVLVSVGMIFVMGVGNPQAWLFGGLFAMSTVGMMSGGMGRGGAQRAETDEQRRDYLRYLSQVRKRIRGIASAQRAALEWTHPQPAVLLGVLNTDRLWERRETDPDFGQVRVGQGRQRLATRLVAPQTGPLDELEPVCAWALRRMIRAHSIVPDLPVAVALCSMRRVCLRALTPVQPGSPGLEPVRAMARAMLAQYVVWHSPAEARLAVITSAPNAPVWDWVKWLPHAQHPTLTDDIGALRMVTSDPAEVTEWLSAPGMITSGADSPPRLVIVVDGVDVRRAGAQWLDRPEITVLRLAEPTSVAGERGELTLMVDQQRIGTVTDPKVTAQPNWIGRPDALTTAEVTTLARRMAKYRPPRGAEPDTGRPLRNTVGLPELLGMDSPAAISVARARWSSSPQDTLRVPLGLGESGEPVLLDIKESGQGGFGPHGLCIGATGSGKSELLRTLLLGLAATHSSDRLNMVLVDFKGGATFLGMSELPHVSAVITNLQDEMTLVDRMADAIAGEINRRQEVLRDAGNLANVGEYERKRQTNPSMPPLPALLIVVDEFSEMLSQRPELVDLMVQIGRLGRSLQMHLLLASQRLDEGRLRGLESHLSYRIALRTFSPVESRAVLGVPDAYQLPPMPGSGYMALGTDELIRFRAAYVSGPVDVSVAAATHAARATAARPRAFTATRVGGRPGDPSEAGTMVLPESETAKVAALAASSTEVLAGSPAELIAAATGRPAPKPKPAGVLAPSGSDGSRLAAVEEADPESGSPPTVLDLMVAAMTGQGPAAHQVWLPPLDTPPALDSMLPKLGKGPRGLSISSGPSSAGSLRVPIGLIDRPYYQRWDQHVVDLSGAHGHVVVIGAPQSGKSMVLRTMLLGLALSNTPRELTIYGLDFGGGMLNAMSKLPHVASVADRQHPDVVRRTMAEVAALLTDRECSFRDAGVESAADFRRRRAQGEFADDPHGDVFLVIDGYSTLRDDFEDLEAQLLPLAMRGLSYAVHLMITANRWVGVRPALKDLLGTRVELRLNDTGDSEIDRRKAAQVPTKPGRGLAPDGGQMVVARPELDAIGGGFAEAVDAVVTAWPGPSVQKVRLLPERMPYAELVAEARVFTAARPTSPHALPIGVDEARLEPVLLDFAAESHLLCFADGESGKTNLLRILAEGITTRMTPEQARLVVVDYRRTLLGQVPPSHLIGYANNAEATATAVRDVVGAMGRRMPGADVTPRQLRERSWWSGPDVYVLVDDYDLVATPSGGIGTNPLMPLLEYLPQAKDVGLHLVVLRRGGGAARALFEPVIARLRELAAPGLLMSGSPDEGPLLEGVKATPQPPGRGTLITRRGGARRIQLALLEPDQDAGEPAPVRAAAPSTAPSTSVTEPEGPPPPPPKPPGRAGTRSPRSPRASRAARKPVDPGGEPPPSGPTRTP
jgi:S-DNA-T family DNA segregation ATPase FtsK/SpoIIIE